MLHEIITGIVACLWSLGYFNHISAKLVHVRTHCFSQPSLNDTLRITLKAQHSRAVGFRMLFLFSPVHAMASTNDSSILICSVGHQRILQTCTCLTDVYTSDTPSTEPVVCLVTEVPGGQKRRMISPLVVFTN